MDEDVVEFVEEDVVEVGSEDVVELSAENPQGSKLILAPLVHTSRPALMVVKMMSRRTEL